MKENSGQREIKYSPESLIKNTAYEIGFSLVGIADMKPSPPSSAFFDKWLARGHHGGMAFLSGGADKRRDPGIMLEGAGSAICVGVNYYSKRNADRNLEAVDSGLGIFSLYAQGEDYHRVLTSMLGELDGRLKSFFPEMRSVICVDTQPISERDFALKSGIAWLGKNTCVISEEYGSWMFLGELITSLSLKSDRPLRTLCGSCTRCLEACPTGALEDAFELNARKCISYLTIEKRGDIPEEYHEPIGNHMFGCDICQQVCPFNRFPRESVVFESEYRNPLIDMSPGDLAQISDEKFLELTRMSAIRRCKAEGMRRNARVVVDRATHRLE
jgi:epoxyqueuosine reductase